MVFETKNVSGRIPNADTYDVTSFRKEELNIIINIYSRKVAAGEWRDYDISHLSYVAVFSVFRNSTDFPIYRIQKQPHLRDRNAMYQIVGMGGRIFCHGNNLRKVMRFFESNKLRIAY